MQNKYTGDIGDFGKYGLLRALCSGDNGEARPLSMGVVWYLVPDEADKKHEKDGKYVDYLTKEDKALSSCDPKLYSALKNIVVTGNGKRCVARIREGDILPPGTIFYERELAFDSLLSFGLESREARIRHRCEWVRCAIQTTEGCDVVFVDPDNGIEVRSVKKHHKAGPKYVFLDELKPYIKRGQSVIVYHHLARKDPAEVQIRKRLSELRRCLGEVCPFALRYHRGTARVFFVIPSKPHTQRLLESAQRFAQAQEWKSHFTMIP